MKRILQVALTLVLALMLCFQSVNSCSIEIPPLRKEFRRAKSVFIGKVLKISDDYVPTEKEKQTIPEYWKEGYWKDKYIFSKVTFEVKKKWKGNVAETQDFVAVAYFFCGCPGGDIDKFKVGEEFLVLATGQNFVTICDSKNANSEWAKGDMKRFDNFWFRTWARIYPF